MIFTIYDQASKRLFDKIKYSECRQACLPLIQFFFGFASDIDQTNINRYQRRQLAVYQAALDCTRLYWAIPGSAGGPGGPNGWGGQDDQPR